MGSESVFLIVPLQVPQERFLNHQNENSHLLMVLLIAFLPVWVVGLETIGKQSYKTK